MNRRLNRTALRPWVASLALVVGCTEPTTPPATTTETKPPAPAAAGSSAPKTTGADSSPAATIDGQTITLGEVREMARPQLMELERQQHTTLEGTLDQLIAKKLLAAEATRRGVNSDELQKQVLAEVAPVTPADVDAFYEQFKDRINQPKEAIAGQILQKISQDRQGEAMQNLIKKLRDAAKVEVLLDPLRATVSTDDDPAMGGAKGAPVTIVEFSDFECGYCARAIQTVKQLTDHYGDKVQLVFRDYPLPFHQKAKKAAEAAGCAHEQGQFWAFHDGLFGNQAELEVEQFKALAAKLGLDAARFATCLDGGGRAAEIDKDIADGSAAGVNGTPAFFINGRFIDGAVPYEQLAQIVDDELRRAGIKMQ